MKQLKLKQLIKEEIVNILREEEDWFVKKEEKQQKHQRSIIFRTLRKLMSDPAEL